MLDIQGPLKNRDETRCPEGVSVSCLASHTRYSYATHKIRNSNKQEDMSCAWPLYRLVQVFPEALHSD